MFLYISLNWSMSSQQENALHLATKKSTQMLLCPCTIHDKNVTVSAEVLNIKVCTKLQLKLNKMKKKNCTELLQWKIM